MELTRAKQGCKGRVLNMPLSRNDPARYRARKSHVPRASRPAQPHVAPPVVVLQGQGQGHALGAGAIGGTTDNGSGRQGSKGPLLLPRCLRRHAPRWHVVQERSNPSAAVHGRLLCICGHDLPGPLPRLKARSEAADTLTVNLDPRACVSASSAFLLCVVPLPPPLAPPTPPPLLQASPPGASCTRS